MEIKKLRGYEITAKAKEAEVWINEDIGEGWFGGISSKQFAEDIRALGDVEKITVHINSPGGDVFEGIAFYSTLKQHSARVVISIDGWAASIASVVAMAGDEINIAESAMIMIHEARGPKYGTASEMRKHADLLEKVNGSIIKTYLTHATIDEEKIIELMAAETWMNADDAIEMGFADQITESLEIAAHVDIAKYEYKHPPVTAKAEPKVDDTDIEHVQPTLTEEVGPEIAEAAPEPPVAKEPTQVRLMDPMTYEADRKKTLQKLRNRKDDNADNNTDAG